MKTFVAHTVSALCLALGLMTAGCAQTGADASATVMSVAAKAPELSTFYRLVQQAGLSEALAAGELTVFAPTDDAFKAVPAATMDKLNKDPEVLKAVLTYHVLSNKVNASKIENNTTLTTLNGAKLTVSKAGDFITVDDGMVVTADVPAGNSVIHEIDRVLLATFKK
jgi:uncharacterized surface protein with fasciclin (FAS1) repeats